MNRTREVRAVAVLLGALLTLPASEHADDAMDIGSGEDAVILEDSLEIEILSEREARVRSLNRTRILTQHGAERYGDASVFYNPWVTIRDLRAAVISPAGKRAEVKKQQVWEGSAFASYELYSDSKHRTIEFPGAVPGATLEHSYELAVHNLYFLPTEFDLQERVPVKLKTITVRAPASFPLRYSVRGASPDYTRVEEDGLVVHRWSARDIPALRNEADMPPWEDVVPRVTVFPKVIVWDEHRIDASTWNGIARWYWDLARDRMIPTDSVSAAAREATAGVHEVDEKVRRLYEFAQGKVNYVAIQLGIGGWQPHASADVLRHRYGDCKDKATLLIAMLRAVGLQGHPVLIRTRDDGLIDRDQPSPAFNHMIVAVPGPEGYRFMDPTSETTSFGDLPWQDQGVPVLVVKEEGQGDLVETPLSPPERNRRHRLVTGQIAATGDLEGNYIIDAWGQRRDDMTGFLDAKPTEREDTVEDLMAWLCPGAQLKGYAVTAPARPGEPLRVTIRFAVPRFAVRAGKAEVVSPHLVRFPGLTSIAAYAARRHPVFFPYLFNETSEARLRLPVGRVLKKIPADRTIEGPGLTASSRYELAREQDRDVLVVRRTVTISRREIPVADYGALRNFISTLIEEESKAVTLELAG
jgi:uncharacterized protein DUF3857/transglutaminase superfamily protein